MTILTVLTTLAVALALTAGGLLFYVVHLKRALDALSTTKDAKPHSVAYLQRALNIAGVVHYEIDLYHPERTYWSDDVYALTGLPRRTIPLTPDAYIDRVVHPADRDRVREHLRRLAEDAQPSRLEHRVQRPDGSVRWIQRINEPVLDATGRVAGFAGALLDVTDRKLSEIALQARTREMRIITDTIPDQILHIDRTLRILFVNKAVVDAYNRGPLESYIGQPNHLLAGPTGLSERWHVHLRRTFETRRPVEFDAATSDGRRTYHSLITPVPSLGGAPETVIAINRDITERLRLQRELLEISSREQQRIGQDLHDQTGQMLTGLGFRVAALEQSIKGRDPDAARALQEISELVEETISQTRLLAEGLTPIRLGIQGLQTGLERLTLKITRMFAVSCRLTTTGAGDVDDEHAALHLYRIAQEAVHNAIRHGEASTIDLHLHLDPEDGYLAVRDNGTGFDASELPDTGLGLRIMDYRAQMIGGTFTIQSTPGHGTRVVCRFMPQATRDPAPAK